MFEIAYEALVVGLIASVLGNCDWEGLVIAVVTNSPKWGWAMSEPA